MSIFGKMKAGMRLALIAVLSVLIGLGLYVRFAPSDPERWHRMPDMVRARDLEGGVMRAVEGGAGELQRLHEIIVGTVRTRVLAGSLDEGMITYVTRSRVFSFPDYTTVRQREGRIEIYGRLRFGASDLGVNGARIDGWLQSLAQRR